MEQGGEERDGEGERGAKRKTRKKERMRSEANCTNYMFLLFLFLNNKDATMYSLRCQLPTSFHNRKKNFFLQGVQASSSLFFLLLKTIVITI